MEINKSSFRGLVLLFIMTVFISCNEEGEDVQIPEGVLSEAKYAKLLVDFSLAESAANLNINSVIGTKYDSAYRFNPLTENGISKSQYDSTVTFYTKHPELHKRVHEEALNILSEMTNSRIKSNSDTIKK